MNEKTLLTFLVIYTIGVIIIGIGVLNALKSKTTLHYEAIIKDLTDGLQALITETEDLLENRIIHSRLLKSGERKVMYNNEYSKTLNESEDNPDGIQRCKAEIASQMIEDILNGKKDVL